MNILRGQSWSVSDQHDPNRNQQVLAVLADKQSTLNIQYSSSEIYYHFRTFFSVYVLLYSVIKIFAPQDFDFKFRLFTIPFLIIIEAAWSEKAVKKFYTGFPITCFLQLLIHLVWIIDIPKIDILAIIFVGGIIVSCQNFVQFRNYNFHVRLVWSICFFFIYSWMKYFTKQEEKGNLMLMFEILLLYPLLGACCALFSIETKIVVVKSKNTINQKFITQAIYFSQLLRTIFLAEYRRIPIFVLLILILQCFFQLAIVRKSKQQTICEDIIMKNQFAVRKYPNTIQIANFQKINVASQLNLFEFKGCQEQEELQLCCFCGVNLANVVFFDCKHSLYCNLCARKYYNKEMNRRLLRLFVFCPICKQFKDIITNRYELITDLKTFLQLKTGKNYNKMLKSTFHSYKILQNQWW